MKILIVGESAPGYAAELIYKNLSKYGNQVDLVNTREFFKTSLLNRVVNRFLSTPHYFGSGIKKLNSLAKQRCQTGGFEYVILIKPILIYPQTIIEMKKHAKLVGLCMDHADFLRSGSNYFYKTIPLFDLYISSIRSNAPAMLDFGAKRSIYMPIFADPTYHYPVDVSADDQKKFGSDVVFVGAYANEKRAKYLEELCEDGYDVLVYGSGWDKLPSDSCLRARLRPAAWCESMSRVIGSSKIALAFMSEHNDEKVAWRTYEIPLCGGFMLHEKTEEAKELLRPGVEAEFFSSYGEMKEKIDFYLAHPDLREKIAKAGRERILNSGNLLPDQMEKLPEILRREIG